MFTIFKRPPIVPDRRKFKMWLDMSTRGTEVEFRNHLPPLLGKCAIVTGGTSKIGVQIVLYLIRCYTVVYVAGRSREKFEKTVVAAKRRMRPEENLGEVYFHHLDLSTLQGARSSAEDFKKRVPRLDIIICNASVFSSSPGELTADGYERAFAINHLGHFAFVMGLLDLIVASSQSIKHWPARIVICSSDAYLWADEGINYSTLTKQAIDSLPPYRAIKAALRRFARSKLANIYFAMELDRRLRAQGFLNILCNAGHTGAVPFSHTSVEELLPLDAFRKYWVRWVLLVDAYHPRDAAKTPIWLATSDSVAKDNVHGEYYTPQWLLNELRNEGLSPPMLKPFVIDQTAHGKCWEFSERAVAKACGGGETLLTGPLDPGWVMVKKVVEGHDYHKEMVSPPRRSKSTLNDDPWRRYAYDRHSHRFSHH
ncbi:MAG: hypothetical protein M1823_004620 [Watsoniomyces obsoletus]|nr:MAG: hypothetical protein M1823_004620 [Watsoniomyces obsoletus]